ncbi:MAG: peptidase domain-containing ABC transporter [Lutibacter sp.]|nr:peptidase domain-containing ABC transporter [Lutibacter sp.]
MFKLFEQHDQMDCGPACVKMIAHHFGKNYTLDTLRNYCSISHDGVSLLGISDALENIGFKTIGGKLTIGQLINDAPLPCVIHWEQNHFVVLYQIKDKNIFRSKTQFHIADPGSSLKKYNEKEFKEYWLSTQSNNEEKGVVLLAEPTHEFYKKEGEKINKGSVKFLFSYFKRYKKYFGQLILGILLGSLLQLIFPFLTQSIVDIGIKNQNIHFIYLVLIAQMVLIISQMSSDFIRRWILLHISTRINISLVSDFFIKLMKLPMSFFDTKLVGDILQRISDHDRVEKFLTSQSLNVIFSFVTFITFGTVLFIYSIKIFALFLIGSIIYTIWIFLFLKKRRELDFKYFEQKSLNQSKTYQIISGMQEIKLQNFEKQKRWEWEDIQADLFKTNIASLKLEQYQAAGNVFINETKNILITVIAATSVVNGELTLGMMLAIQYIIGQLKSPIDQIVNFIHEFQDTQISLERINEIHQKEDENSNKLDDFHNKLESDKNIYIENLAFQYDGVRSPKVLNDVNLTIPQGKVTAIVGASGSGKTTLIKLLLQYYNATQGVIKIGSKNLNEYNTTFWRNQCGAVMQDGFIFSDTIAQNIAVTTNDNIDKERLKFAAKVANISNFINEMPLKYNTIIGQEGQGLSQGQKQRILIARAVYKNPQYVFLDEATNALDANNEMKITESLRQFFKDKTVIIVAHRLSTVKNADQIIVLDDGKIIERGNHKDLTAKRGAYYNLVKNQLELGN